MHYLRDLRRRIDVAVSRRGLSITRLRRCVVGDFISLKAATEAAKTRTRTTSSKIERRTCIDLRLQVANRYRHFPFLRPSASYQDSVKLFLPGNFADRASPLTDPSIIISSIGDFILDLLTLGKFPDVDSSTGVKNSANMQCKTPRCCRTLRRIKSIACCGLLSVPRPLTTQISCERSHAYPTATCAMLWTCLGNS